MSVAAAAVLCLPLAAGAAAPPPDAFRPIALSPLPAQAVRQCQAIQRVAAFTVLCPAQLPRAWIASPQGKLPRLRAHRGIDPNGSAVAGVYFDYGAPWEPDSRNWRAHVWADRPCCFLHFEVFRRPAGARWIPDGATQTTIAGRHGLLARAHGYGQGSGRAALYSGNHDRFLFTAYGTPYVASLHYFGARDTFELLSRLVAQLVPASRLRTR